MKTLLTLTLSLLGAVPLAASAAGGQPNDYFGANARAASTTVGGSYNATANNSYANVNVKAVASASVVDGSLHAYAWSSNDPVLSSYCFPFILSCNWGTSADAWFWDKATLQAGAGYEPGELVEWTWAAHGTTTRGNWWSGSSATSYFYLGTDPNGWRNATLLDVKNQSRQISGSFRVPEDGSALTLYAYGSLSVFAEGGAVADYSHTARFSWHVPEGVTVTSASGQFMTAPVPEPASAALMLAGLVALPWARRRLAPSGG